MKARFFAIAAMVLSLASCQRDQAGLDSVVAGEQDVNITVALPEVTRATNSEVGALGNIDLTKYDIRYILEVYEGEDLAKERFVNYENDARSTNFSMRLIPGRDYRFVVWADFVKEGTQVDLHYNTANLKSVEAINLAAIDESRDAYTAICNVENFSSAKGIPAIELKRPFGKLRVQTTDVNQMTTLRPVGVTVRYFDTKFAHKFNAFTSEAIAEYVEVAPVTVDLTKEACKYTNEKPEENGLQTLYADYFFATESGDVKFDFDVKLNDGTVVPTLSFNTYIPVKRNVLTTVRGNVLTDGASIDVFINDAFEGEYANVESTTSLADSLEEVMESVEATIELTEDVEWETGAGIGSTPWIPEGAKTQKLTVNANGHKITATGAGVGKIRMANGGLLIINDAVIVDESVSYAENSWECGYLEFGGKLEFNNCEFVNAVMMSGDEATFNNCEFNSHKDNEYAVWVDNGSAYFNACAFEGPRAIKVHEAYGSEVAEVKVNACAFTNIYKKPGMAIGTVNAETTIAIENSEFIGCQAGDQGLYIYETDTAVNTFNFTENNNTVVVFVSTPETLAQVLTANEEVINVTLVSDIDLPISSLGQITGGSGEYKLGGEATEAINIDLNGKTLNITTTYWSDLGAKNENALFTIKNGTMTSSQATGTWNSYDLCFSNCNYVFEDVTFNKAIALESAGKTFNLKNITITETRDYYAMWIAAKGQTVNIDGLTINSLGRGIKIDEQYVDAPAKVTLNINDADFNTKKKAAILVKSVAGADITLSNVDIAGAFDKANAVWVDEDSKAYADKVTVTGGSMAVEGENVVEAGASDFANAILNVEDGATIVLADGNYTMPATGGKDIAIVGGKDTVINLGATNTGSSDVTLYGVTINAGQYKGFQHSGVVTYNNVTIKGELFCYGEKDIFNNCTFELNNGYVWTYGSKEVVFEGCTFNTNGKAILVYNEGAGATKVAVNNCTFNATAGAKAGAIKNQNCAAIEIDNYQNSLVGVAHNITTSNNTVGENFSGEWRIKNYVAGDAINVNGTAYTQIAIDGKLMTIDASKNVTVL